MVKAPGRGRSEVSGRQQLVIASDETADCDRRRHVSISDQPDTDRSTLELDSRKFSDDVHRNDFAIAIEFDRWIRRRVSQLIASAARMATLLPPDAVRLVPGSSWGTFTIACTIPIALLVGL